MGPMTDLDLQKLSALTSLNAMMRKPYFDVCTVDTVIKMLGTVPDRTAHDMLRSLHCVNWSDMPIELRDAVPKLIERCCNVPAYQFQRTFDLSSTPKKLIQ